MSGNSTLASLLLQSRNLTSHLDHQELPQLHLGLDQVEEQSRKLVGKGKRGDYREDGEEARAAHLLATAGLNLADLTYRVDRATAPAALGGTFEPLIPLSDGDVDGYLRHTREQLILTALSESHAQLSNSFYQTLDTRLRSSWDAQKRKILEEVGAGDVLASSSSHLGSSTANGNLGGSAFGRSVRGRLGESSSQGGGLASSLSGQPIAGQTISSQNRMLKYDTVVRQLNASRSGQVPSSTYHLLKNYAASLSAANSAASTSSNQTSPLLAQTFSLLSNLVREGDQGVGERCYAAGYLGENGEGEGGRKVRRGIADGGKKFLEEQFQAHVDRRVAAQPVQAGLGGVPSVANKVKGFVRVQHYKEGRWKDDIEIVNSQPIWAQMYYLIRSGHLEEAYELALENEDGIGRTERFFVGFFKGWLDSPDRRLPRTQRERFMTEYNLRIRHSSSSAAEGGNSGDPFKHALYRLLGRIDVRKNVSVARTTEDWVWFQLSFVREDDAVEDTASGDKYGLRDMGKLVSKFGERHFDPRGDRPVFWFQVLMFVGEFEKAVAFLYSKSQHQVDAIQFAVALAYYGLLRVPSKAQVSDVDLLTTIASPSSTHDISYLNFVRLVQRYIKPFAKSDPQPALQYIYLICLSADVPLPTGREQVETCHEMIRDLVLDSGAFAELLGTIKTDGTRVPGAIERDIKLAHIPDERSYLLGIVKVAASRTSSQQRLSDAIILYNLAEDYDTVVAVLNKALGASLSQPASSNGTASGEATSIGFGAEQDISSFANGILDHYQKDLGKWNRVGEKNRETCRVLLRLKEAFLFYQEGRLEQALEFIESISLLPLSSDISAINRRADEFKDLDEPIAHNFSDVLIVTMNCLFKLHQALKESSYGGEARQSKMAEYRKKARSLMMFAGMLRYRMSQEVYQQLTRLDAFF